MTSIKHTGEGIITGLSVAGAEVTVFHRTRASSATTEAAFGVPPDAPPILGPLLVEAFARGLPTELDYEPAATRETGGTVRAVRVCRD